MVSNPRDRSTSEFGDPDPPSKVAKSPEIEYLPVPHHPSQVPEGNPVWRVHFDLLQDKTLRLGLDVNGEVTFGRGLNGADYIDLTPFRAEDYGVSRRHIILRPTLSNLYVLDLGSTNGTRRNGLSIGANTPYSLSDGDLLSLGQLEFVVNIVKRPLGRTSRLSEKASLGEAMILMAKAISSQLELDEVLNQALEMAMLLSEAGETSMWLFDEASSELELVAELGIEDESFRRTRIAVADTVVGEVIASGKSIIASSTKMGERIKIKTGYLVDEVIYVPLTIGGVSIGVLMAARHKQGKPFGAAEQELLEALADIAAIAIQNARVYEATDRELARRIDEVNELNRAMSHDIRNLLNSILGYGTLLELSDIQDGDVAHYIAGLMAAVRSATNLIGQVLEISRMQEVDGDGSENVVDLAQTAQRAIQDLEGAALSKRIEVVFAAEGDIRQVPGNELGVYRSLLNVIENAIKYTQEGGHVWVWLAFEDQLAMLTVRDDGPGIPDEELADVFDKFFRGSEQLDRQTIGTGLGLSMVKGTIEAHGGTVVAYNAEGAGAEIVITLPAI